MPIISGGGGGGGGLPSQWTAASGGELTMTLTAPDTAVTIIQSGAGAIRGVNVAPNDAAGSGGAMVLYRAENPSDENWSTYRSFQAIDDDGVSEYWYVDDIKMRMQMPGNPARAVDVGQTFLRILDSGVTPFYADNGSIRLGYLTDPTGNLDASQFGFWLTDTVNAPKLKVGVKDSAANITTQIVEQASPITSGALPTVALVSGAGTQILVARAVETITPFTGDGTNNAATCAIALSPDNVTYSTLATISIAAALNLTGVLTDTVNCRVPAGWYLRLTATHGTLGTTTYY